MTSRRKSRELAVIALYQLEVGKYDLEELLGDTIRREEISTNARPFFRALIRQVWQDRALLDQLIDHAAEGWRVERLNKLDLSVMRVGVCELTTPILQEVGDPAVVINEAVVIAKRYCGEENARFVNGVLGKITGLEAPLQLAGELASRPAPAEVPPKKVLPKVADPLVARQIKLQERYQAQFAPPAPPPAEELAPSGEEEPAPIQTEEFAPSVGEEQTPAPDDTAEEESA